MSAARAEPEWMDSDGIGVGPVPSPEESDGASSSRQRLKKVWREAAKTQVPQTVRGGLPAGAKNSRTHVGRSGDRMREAGLDLAESGGGTLADGVLGGVGRSQRGESA